MKPSYLRHRNAFTLIELLVLITIIVVLLALLAPAMDKAIYEAELVVCAARQKTMGATVTLYAMDFARAYPYRRVLYERPPVTTLHESQPGVLADTDIDDRPLFKQYVALKAFVEPMAQDVSLEIEDADGLMDVHAGYSLYAGVKFTGFRGMMKVGDRMTYRDYRRDFVEFFDLLTADFDLIIPESLRYLASHPDDEALLPPLRYINDPLSGTFSRYDNYESPSRRGRLDQNFGHADGSVSTARGVASGDNRMAWVPYRVTSENYGPGLFRVQIPPQ